METPGGKYVIIDLTNFLPGRKIPQQYIEESDDGRKPFFFIPSDWNDENCWGGTWMNYRLDECNRFPMCYSIGFETAEEALAEATRWEATESERRTRERQQLEALRLL